MSTVADISKTSSLGSHEPKARSYSINNSLNQSNSQHRKIGESFSSTNQIDNHHITSPSWTDQIKAALSHLPNYLPDSFPIHRIPILRNYVLNFIMPWVLRDPEVASFDPEIFIQKGYKVSQIPNNKNIRALRQ